MIPSGRHRSIVCPCWANSVVACGTTMSSLGPVRLLRWGLDTSSSCRSSRRYDVLASCWTPTRFYSVIKACTRRDATNYALVFPLRIMTFHQPDTLDALQSRFVCLTVPLCPPFITTAITFCTNNVSFISTSSTRSAMMHSATNQALSLSF